MAQYTNIGILVKLLAYLWVRVFRHVKNPVSCTISDSFKHSHKLVQHDEHTSFGLDYQGGRRPACYQAQLSTEMSHGRMPALMFGQESPNQT
jgi:hypothetical protein